MPTRLPGAPPPTVDASIVRRVRRGISLAATPQRGAVIQRARELVDYARHHGYRRDELIEIIRSV